MRGKVSATIEQMQKERQDYEAKIVSLNNHIKTQNVDLDEMKQMHKTRKLEWEKALAQSAGLVKQREGTIATLKEQMAEMENAHRSACASHAVEVAALREAVNGHVADKQYLDSTLAQVREHLSEEEGRHQGTRVRPTMLICCSSHAC